MQATRIMDNDIHVCNFCVKWYVFVFKYCLKSHEKLRSIPRHSARAIASFSCMKSSRELLSLVDETGKNA